MSPSKIEWCDETLNPQGWGCWGPAGMPGKPRRCWYCYAERVAHSHWGVSRGCELCRQFIPHWHPEQLEKPLHWTRPRRIFWQSMGDLWHPDTPKEQIEQVLEIVKLTPRHSHIFCTKNPVRYQDINSWPDNCILLTTYTGLGETPGRLVDLLKANCRIRGVSLEPLLGPIELEMASYYLQGFPGCINFLSGEWWPALGNAEEEGRNIIQMNRLNWLIIGAMSGKGASRFVPNPAWVQSLIGQARNTGVPMFLKNNLNWPEKIQEWPQ